MRTTVVIASTSALLACGPGEPSDDTTRGSDTIADGDATETDDGDDEPGDGDGDGEPGDGDDDGELGDEQPPAPADRHLA